MIPISDALREKFKAENPQKARITLTPVSGSVVTITEADIVQGTFYVNRACTASESLELGSVISSEFGCTLFNDGGKFDGVNFEGAELHVEVGIDNYISLGYYTIDDIPKVRNTISIVALDRMMFFDAEVKDSTIKGANRTIKQYIDRMCTVCGVTCATNIASYPNYNYVVPKFPDEVGITYRQLLSWCCQIMGKNAYVDWNGLLRIEFPDVNILDDTSAIAGIAVAGKAIVGTGTAITWITEDINETMRFESDFEDYSVTTTGVYHVDGEGNETILGTEDYAFDVSGNSLLQTPSIIQNLSNVIGIRYVPFSATTIPMPYLMPMDYVIYRKDEQPYAGLLTSVTFRLNAHTEIASVGESQKARSYARRGAISSATRLVLERTVAELNTEINDAVDEAVLQASALINASLTGYVVLKDTNNDGHPDELLIMDTPDTATATRVWRWNQNGLGYSSTGYSGSYGLAMTANGQIVADFITAGVFTAGGDGATINVKNSSGDIICALNTQGIETSALMDDWFGFDFYGKTRISSGHIEFYYRNGENGEWVKYGAIEHSHTGSATDSYAGLSLYSFHNMRISSGEDMEIERYDSDAHTATTINLRVGEVLIGIGAVPANYYPRNSGAISVRKGSVVASVSTQASASATTYSKSLTLDTNGMTLSDGTNSITIKPTSNVATLSYTVVSTF